MARAEASRSSGLARVETVPRPRVERGAAGSAVVSTEWVALETLYRRERDAWVALAREALEPNVFLDPDFAVAAAANLLGGPVGAAAVREGGRLVGLLPGKIEGLRAGRPVRTFVVWTHPFAPLSTPLIHRDISESAVRTMLETLPQFPGAPRLALFPLLAEEGPVAQLFLSLLKRKGRDIHRFDPYRRAALIPGKAGAGLSVSARRQGELRRQHRRLSELGNLKRQTATAPDDVRAALADYLELEAKGWKGQAGSAARLDPATAAFMNAAVHALAAERKARIDCLRLDGRAIAATITLFSGDRAWGWKTAYDESFARFSPGMQLAFDLSQRLGEDEHLSLVDSCAAPGGGIVDHMWPGRMAMADWLIPLEDGLSFSLALAAERARRAAIASAKALRGLVRRSG